MSKERLEEFREFIDFMYESIDIEDHQRFVAISESMIKDGWFKWIYRYAKEQTERVLELEEYKESYEGVVIALDNMSETLLNEEQQNNRYREALEFYADRDNYFKYPYPIVTDGGGEARKALECESE